MLSRELVLKEAKRLELEKKDVEAERKRKSLEVKYEAGSKSSLSVFE